MMQREVTAFLPDHVGWTALRFRSADGLSLHARDYGHRDNGATPAVCLSGLTRNAKDFHQLACRLARHRRVLAPDYRGRGLSDYAPDPAHYTVEVELDDVRALFEAAGITRAVVIGTSRGGIIAMLMAATSREMLAGVVLNDIGPVLEVEGLLRIASYLGAPPPDDWSAVVAYLRKTNPGFTGLDDAAWEDFARRIFRDEDGRPALDYDMRLASAFPDPEIIKQGEIPPFWNIFEALRGLPAGLLRGEHSDLLSEDTMAEMRRRVPELKVATVPGRAHTPFLDEPESLALIDAVIAEADGLTGQTANG